MDIAIPTDIENDIDYTFSYREDSTYQQRSHEYLERYDISRRASDTAVQAAVYDLCERAFEAGMKVSKPSATPGSESIPPELKAIMLRCAAVLVETAGKVDAL